MQVRGLQVFGDSLITHAEGKPDELAFGFLGDGETETARLTFAELDAIARAIAVRVLDARACGEPVLLVYPPGLDYVAGFLGCLYAGAIAVPLYPPDPARIGRMLPRLGAIVTDSRARVVLTTSSIKSMVDAHLAQAPVLRGLRWLSTDTVTEPVGEVPARRGGLAYLQYTSGSTGDPKGVLVSHQNLIDNCAAIAEAWRLDEATRIASWLPLYHDMGLIAGILLPIYLGVPSYFMPPVAFIQRPVRWLRAIDRFGATFSGGPNFAFDLCVNKVSDEDRDGLDLSRWRVAFNGAEPVRAATLRRFAAAFSWSGFRREALCPCYGLAEATLLVAADGASAPPQIIRADARRLGQGRLVTASAESEGTRELVSCGIPAGGSEVAIVDLSTFDTCPDGQIGEVWVRGRSVAGGYHGRAEETERTFAARTSAGNGPYLRTGDLGFSYDGQLYLAARHKDLIIVRGRNHYPQDLEHAAESSHPLLRLGCVVAFATQDDERVIIVQEVREAADASVYAAAMRAIRLAVAEQCGIAPAEIALVGKGEVAKTSSGKVQRAICRSRYLSGALTVLAVDSDGEPLPAPVEVTDTRDGAGQAVTAESVRAWLARTHARLAAEPDVALVALGFDSLRLMELAHQAQSTFAAHIEVAELLDGMTAAHLTELICDRSGQCARPSISMAADEAPMSPGQRALWFLRQLHPDSPAYNQVFAAAVRGPLDVKALRTALALLARRHPILRTTYREQNGELLQRVHTSLPVGFSHVDATGWTRERERARLESAVHQPFDLAAGPVLHALVLTRRDGDAVLLLRAHHIALDFWSLGILIDELGICYQATVEGTEPTLKPLAFTYLDHAEQSRRSLTGPAADEHWRYWRSVLAGRPGGLDLPVASRRPPVFGNRGATHTFTFDGELTQRVHAFARSERVTLHVLALTVFAALLHRYSGQDDIVIGTPASGRGDAAFAGTLGYFINMVPVRTDFSCAPSLRELLARVHNGMLGGLAHQALPFSELVDRLGVEREASRSPLFDVAFLVQTSYRSDASLVRFALGEPGSRLSLGGLELASLDVSQRVARFDLELWIAQEEDGLLGSLRYCTDLFSGAAAEQLMRHFVVLLDRALARPDDPLEELPLLSAAEHRLMVDSWNDTAAPYSADVCLHELFEAAADRTPDRVAVLFEQWSATYAQVEAQANRIGNSLLARGVKRGDKIAVVLDRGADLVPALLGVLKAGAAYVPVEPAHPTARIASILARLSIRWVLTTPKDGGQLGDVPGVLHVDDLLSGPADRPPRQSDPGDIAYVIMTSGSSGAPKGVAVAHRPVVNTIEWVNGRYRIGGDDRMLFVTSPCFDLSVYDMFGMLAAGGSVRVASSRDIADPQRLVDWLRSGEITFWDSAPAALTRLAPLLDPGSPTHALRLVFLSGDWIPVTLPGRITAAFPSASVISLGGATEAAIWSNFHEITAVDPNWSSIPYGRPIQNARYYILDRSLNPCPLGVPGELYIGGYCLASGYADDPALSAQKFVRDPFSKRPGATMYRTGDRARFWPDGTIEFLGRVGTMVKVRGYRIEPGEIETLLTRHPQVREAAIVAVGERGSERLVAYVTPEADSGGQYLVDQWKQVFDDVYDAGPPTGDPSFNIAGWVDGHTGLPFSEHEMREWVDTTVERIRGLIGDGARVLEIGCGTGLLLARLASGCSSYVGTDVSASALAHVHERLLSARPELSAIVELRPVAADGLDALAGRHFDLVVINSVAQYFPSVEYLVNVLRSAASLLAPGGSAFLGDLRNLALERDLRISTLLRRAGDAASPREIAAQAIAESGRERELLVHPDLFAEVCARMPEFADALILVKNGRIHNELTRFRHDVILSTAPTAIVADTAWYWEGEGIGELAGKIVAARAGSVLIRDIWDARLAATVRAREMIEAREGPDTVGELRAGLEYGPPAMDPADAHGITSLLPGGQRTWQVQVRWPESGRPGRFDLLVSGRGVTTQPARVSSGRPWSSFANAPARRELAGSLVPKLREDLRAQVPEYMVPSTFVIVPGGLPVTANGKLDRAALPEPDRDRSVVAAQFVPPRGRPQELLAGIWRDVLGVGQVGIHDHFFELGGDSILGIQVVARATRQGIPLVPRDLFQYQTIAELAAAAASRTSSADHPTDADAPDGGIPLTPAQHWFFGLGLAEAHHFNQSFLFQVEGQPLDADIAEQAVWHAFARHDALYLRFRHGPDGWRQELAADQAVVVTRLRDGTSEVPARKIADEQNAMLDLTNGPLARVVVFTDPSGHCGRLLIVVHHLVVDGVSWWALLDDLGAAYAGLRRGEPEGEVSGTSFRQWARALHRYAARPELRGQVPQWTNALAGPLSAVPRDRDDGNGLEADACTVTRGITATETGDLLQRASTAYRTHTDELLLAALVTALHGWSGITRVRIDVESHGRDVLPDLNVSRTVGWFTAFTPALFDVTGLRPAEQPGAVLTAVKEQLRGLPGSPADFGLLRQQPGMEALDELPAAEIGFSYLGQLDRMGGDRFRLVPGGGGTWRGASNHRPYLIEVNCHVLEGRLEVAVTYSKTVNRHDTMIQLADGFVAALRALVTHCTTPGTGDYTPSDFPLAGFDQRSLTAALDQFRGAQAHPPAHGQETRR